MKSSTYALIAIAALMLAVIFNASSFHYFRAKAFPMAVAGIILCLVIVELAKEFRGKQSGRLAYEKDTGTDAAKGFNVKYLSEGGWLAGFCLAVYLLGFLIALPLFGISYLVSHGRGWPAALAVALLTTAILYSIFFYLLGVNLYSGVIMESLGW